MSVKPQSDLSIVTQKKADDILSNLLGSRILLVEDNAANLLVAITLLEMFGYEFDVAQTGYEAVEKAKSGLYKIIIMDMRMPDINGIEITRLIRDYECSQNKVPTKILCVTADALVGDNERCLTAGMNDYLAKPYQPEELQQKLAMLSQS